jgi:hypothetical protein
MKSKQFTFYSTKNDMLEVFEKVESLINFYYTSTNISKTGKETRYLKISEINSLGFTDYESWLYPQNSYLLIDSHYSTFLEPVKQIKDGTINYHIDQLHNLNSVELSTSGIYSKAEKIIVAGRVATISKTMFSEELFKIIKANFLKTHTKLGSEFVGKEAIELLKYGWRLTTMISSPIEYDVKLLS